MQPGRASPEELRSPLDVRERVLEVVGRGCQELVLLPFEIFERGDVLEDGDPAHDATTLVSERSTVDEQRAQLPGSRVPNQKLVTTDFLTTENGACERQFL